MLPSKVFDSSLKAQYGINKRRIRMARTKIIDVVIFIPS